MTMKVEELQQEYLRLMHAVQSGIAYMGTDAKELEPKHLRTGINSALIQNSALARVLLAKGIISEEEYWTEQVKVAKEEVEVYKRKLEEKYGKPPGSITLG